jgi:UDP-2,3-diacylglucosamine pyrophosphatase LpxH
MQPELRHYRSIFLSDIHLGTRGCQAERLTAFLKFHTCDRLYLVGDIVDGWRLRSGIYWPQSHNNVMRRFLTAAKRGTEVIYVTGNHDEFLRRYADLHLGNLQIVDRIRHISADGKELLVVHGDEFDVITRYHRWIAFAGDMGYTLLLHLNRYVNGVRRRMGYGYWSMSAWLKHKVKRAVNFISEFEVAIARRCRIEGYDGVICGHIHHAEIRDLEGVKYMNCGDWVESCTALVEDEDGVFSIVHWPQMPRVIGEVVPFRERIRA